MTDTKLAYKLGRAFRLGIAFALCRKHSAKSLTQDADNDDVIFRTSKSGKHYAIDPNKGTIKGGLGKENDNAQISKPSYPKSGQDLTKTKPTKTPEQYLAEASGNVRKAIVNYYDNELRGGYVNTDLELPSGKTENVKVEFTQRGRNEFRKFAYFPQILECLPFVTDVILTGKYAGRKTESNHGDEVAFHTKIKKVVIGKKAFVMAVDIAENKVLDFYAYSINREGTKSFANKKRELEKKIKARKNKIGQDSSLYFCSLGTGRFLRPHDSSFRLVNDSIGQNNANVKFEVVCIRIL